MNRPDGFYWVQVESMDPVQEWEPARWHRGLWLTLGGPMRLEVVVKVGDRIPEPPPDMPFEEVEER